VSSEAAKKATGHDWAEWKSILDKAGAKKWNHKEIVAYLQDNYKLSGWWQQTVTVAYEKAEGRRVIGQTADTGFQVGIQKTLPIGIGQAWSLLSSRKGIACWLGKVSRLSLAEGRTYKTESGIEGEIRVVKPGNRIRLTWRKTGMKRPATLQITLVESPAEKTSIRVHLEHLPSQKVREEMKSHWRGVLSDLAELAASK
jgi:uncharacterized protein YndB with AHSA1/START domain